jgi:hypothetical protein
VCVCVCVCVCAFVCVCVCVYQMRSTCVQSVENVCDALCTSRGVSNTTFFIILSSHTKCVPARVYDGDDADYGGDNDDDCDSGEAINNSVTTV